ncbi:hypothetical protein M407DRAFT_170627 [Tulasnella calospora MUT 4182]|uniref:Uncharacterized protein n=1 Tax=Tulasnella calospora MUT 4182 TaxID=1051891 RepID=A0A0C3QMY7_9AGAM|nr:hypothetical protein M407DRAFT_170627 [Tulasnella calospora MUT 4182]
MNSSNGLPVPELVWVPYRKEQRAVCPGKFTAKGVTIKGLPTKYLDCLLSLFSVLEIY